MRRLLRYAAAAAAVPALMLAAAEPSEARGRVRLTFVNQAVLFPEAECRGFRVTEVGSGHGNAGLGRFTWRSRECVSVHAPLLGMDPSPPAFDVHEGRFELITASGDALCGGYEAWGSAVGLLLDRVELEVTWWPEGGTGRYRGADGPGGSGWAVVTRMGTHVEGELTGAIKPDAASRSARAPADRDCFA